MCAIQSQREDHFYKELSIKPVLGFVTKSGELTVAFRNQGLGPAQIKEAVYSVGGKCLNLHRSGVVDHENDSIYHETFYPGSVDRETEHLLIDSLRWRLVTEVLGKEPIPLIYQSRILVPTVVTVGDEVVVFGLERSVVEPFHNWIKELGRQNAQPILDRFSEQAAALPISVKYCSISGEYCRSVIRKDDANEPCRLSDK